MDSLLDILITFVDQPEGWEDYVKRECHRVVDVEYPTIDPTTSMAIMIRELPRENTKNILLERIKSYYGKIDNKRLSMVIELLQM